MWLVDGGPLECTLETVEPRGHGQILDVCPMLRAEFFQTILRVKTALPVSVHQAAVHSAAAMHTSHTDTLDGFHRPHAQCHGEVSLGLRQAHRYGTTRRAIF